MKIRVKTIMIVMMLSFLIPTVKADTQETTPETIAYFEDVVNTGKDNGYSEKNQIAKRDTKKELLCCEVPFYFFLNCSITLFSARICSSDKSDTSRVLFLFTPSRYSIVTLNSYDSLTSIGIDGIRS